MGDYLSRVPSGVPWTFSTPWFQKDLPAVRQGLQSFVLGKGFRCTTPAVNVTVHIEPVVTYSGFVRSQQLSAYVLPPSFSTDGTQCFQSILVAIYSGVMGHERAFVQGAGFVLPKIYHPDDAWIRANLIGTGLVVNRLSAIYQGTKSFVSKPGFAAPVPYVPDFEWLTKNLTSLLRIFSGGSILGPGFTKPLPYTPDDAWLFKEIRTFDPAVYAAVLSELRSFVLAAGFKPPVLTHIDRAWIKKNLPAIVATVKQRKTLTDLGTAVGKRKKLWN